MHLGHLGAPETVRLPEAGDDGPSPRTVDAQFYLAGSISGATVKPLLDAVGRRVGEGARSILLALSSPGGHIYWGLTAYNYLRGLGIDVITHNAGQVDSIAGVVYAAGDRRLCVSHGRFLIHGLAAAFIGTDPSVAEDDLQDRMRAIGKDHDVIADILAERTGKELAEVRQDILARTILTAQEAKEYGLVHEIVDRIFDHSLDIFQVIAPT